MNSSIVPSGYVNSGKGSPECFLPSNIGYVLYSAIGSFYAPMLVMLFFNYRIYQVASKTIKSLRAGNVGELGIHRGKGSVSDKALKEQTKSEDPNNVNFWKKVQVYRINELI